MLKGLTYRWKGMHQVAGVDIFIHPDNQWVAQIIILQIKGDQIIIADRYQNITTIDELQNCIPKNSGISLSLSGKGIISKKIETTEVQPLNRSIQLVLPNAKVDDFYVQTTIISNFAFLSIARSELIAQWKKLLTTAKIPIVHIYLESFSLATISPLLDHSIRIPVHQKEYIIKDNKLIEISILQNDVSNTSIRLEQELISPLEITAYSNAFAEISGQYHIFDTYPSNNDREEWVNKNKFQHTGWALISIIFSALICNYFLFVGWQKESNKLVSDNQLLLHETENINTLKQELDKKRNFLGEAGWIDPSKGSYYIDQICATKPSTIKLVKLHYQPLDKLKTQLEKTDQFTPYEILVEGKTKTSESISPWIKQLEKLVIVKKAQSVRFSYNHKTKFNEFTILIQVVH